MSTNDDLLQDLNRVLDAVDPVHAVHTDAAKAAFETRLIDAQLASLRATAEDLVLRGDGTADDHFAFAFDDGSVELTVVRGVLTGQVVPPDRVAVELHTPEGPSERTESDEFGYFEFVARPRGPVSVVVRRGDAGAVRTAWHTF